MEKVQTEHILGMLFFGAACRAWGEVAVRGKWGVGVGGKVGKWGEGEKGRRGKKGEKGPFFGWGEKAQKSGCFCAGPAAGRQGPGLWAGAGCRMENFFLLHFWGGWECVGGAWRQA